MATDIDTTRLSPEREQEIRETHPGDWYAGAWTQDDVDPENGQHAYCRVVHHESQTTLATLPDWAGPIALFIADAHDAVPELLAEIDRIRKELDDTAAALHRNRERRIKAELRVRELERPAIEAKRNETRQSFTELAAAARETRDYEGAFNVECHLREREAQWAAEDASPVAAPSEPT